LASAALFNQAAGPLRRGEILAARLRSAISHAPDTMLSNSIIESIAYALLHTLEEASSALGHIERIS
jgi:hypothetical protein